MIKKKALCHMAQGLFLLLSVQSTRRAKEVLPFWK